MKVDSAHAMWSPQRAKSFENALATLIATEFPRLGGPKVIDLFIDEIKGLIERFYPKTERVSKGMIAWTGVDKNDYPARNKTISQTQLKPCILPLVTDDDFRFKDENPGRCRMLLLKNRIVRLLITAYQQYVVLSYPEVALMCLCSVETVSKLVKEYEQENKTSLPCRATVHDLGSKISHKALICKMRYVDKLSTAEIAKLVFHEPESVDRYLKDYERVVFCLRRGMQIEQIAFSTKMSLSLVQEYVEIYHEINNVKEQN